MCMLLDTMPTLNGQTDGMLKQYRRLRALHADVILNASTAFKALQTRNRINRFTCNIAILR